MGTLKGFASPFGPPPATSTPLASLGLANPPAMVRRRRAPHASTHRALQTVEPRLQLLGGKHVV